MEESIWRAEVLVALRNAFVGAAIAVALLVTATGVGWQRVRSSLTPRERIYRVGFDGAPPLSEIGPRGEPGGLAVALIQEAAKRREITLQWIALPGVSPEVALLNGSVDIWPAVAYSENRRKVLHLTRPWLAASFALVSKKEMAVVLPADVAGKAVAFTGYQVATKIASQYLPYSVLTKEQSRSDVLRSVCTGRVAAGFDESSYLNMLLLDRPAECAGVALSVQIVDGATSPVSIAARRDAAGAADEIRSVLDDLAADGTMTRALNRWASFSANETRSIFELREANDRRFRLQWGLAVSMMALVLLAWQVLRARRAMKQAGQANKAKSEFLANMSHEIRTPMNGVLGMLDVVLDAPISEGQRGDLSVARDSAASLLAILTDILDVSKIEAGRMKLLEAPFGPVACISDVVRLFDSIARGKGLSLEFVSSTVPERVVGDELRFRQILTNLVSNALKFTDRGSVNLLLSAEKVSLENIKLRITIADTGIGIPLEQQSHLFSKFMQVDSSTRRRFGGTGLGLSIAKSLVDLMHGTISLTSAAGQGSSFRVELPFKIPSGEERQPVFVPREDSTANQQTIGVRVLIAEDNRVNQLVISRFLESLGYSVDIAENGEMAVERCQHTTYAAILMDCQMPIMDGYEASAAIRKSGSSNQSVPIIAVTAHALHGDEARCLAAGMTDYITKPISKASLLRVMSAVTRGEPTRYTCRPFS